MEQTDKLITAMLKGKKYSSLQLASPLRELMFHVGSHSVTCHLAKMTFLPLPLRSWCLI